MKTLNPPDWLAPKGYANGVMARGSLLFVGGQIGWNAQQEFESDDFIAQARQALLNLRDGESCPPHVAAALATVHDALAAASPAAPRTASRVDA